MASNKQTFAAPIDEWVRKSEIAMRAVLHASAQDLFERVQVPAAKGGHMPVVTGFLRSSFMTTLNTPYQGFIQRQDGKNYDYNESQVTLTIAGANLGDKIYGVFAANYAVYQEYGTSKMTGKFFVRHAAQMWQKIVSDNVQRLRV